MFDQALVFFVLLAVNCVYAIPVSVMMNLDLFNISGQIVKPRQLDSRLSLLAKQGVAGVMVDVWWGIVEQQPQQYYWDGYAQFFSAAQRYGLTVQVVMSFHQCGSNVGDACYFPLPPWVTQVRISTGKNYWYTSIDGWEDPEYISLGADDAAIFPPRSSPRTPVQMYAEFMQAFAGRFRALFGSVIDEAQIGLGPAGEMRYPGYPLAHNWQYCGVGGFMVYDDYLKQALSSAAAAHGRPLWGLSGPDSVGGLNVHPGAPGQFFTAGAQSNYASAYGDFFLQFYAAQLLAHADRVLSAAYQALPGLPLAYKVSGIHWWYLDHSHAAEATSGYYNTNNHNAYASIALALRRFNATFDFTCLEMTNPNGGGGCDSAPASLVQQTLDATRKLGVRYAGENALPICSPGSCNQAAFDQVYQQATYGGQSIAQFTFLRLDDNLFNPSNNFFAFQAFVQRMKAAK